MTNQYPQPNIPATITALRELAANDLNALAYLTLLSTRQKSMRHGRVTAEYLQTQFETEVGWAIDRPQAVALIKALAEAGGGRYLRGRSGRKTRIEWAYSTTTIGRAAIGDVDSLTPLRPNAPHQPTVAENTASTTASGVTSIETVPPTLAERVPEPAQEPDMESISVRMHAPNGARFEFSGPPSQLLPVLRELAHDDDNDGPQPPYLRLSA
jgi:hypothetical protein